MSTGNLPEPPYEIRIPFLSACAGTFSAESAVTPALKCLAAFTAPGKQYPPYLNVSEEPNGDVHLLVRGDPRTVTDYQGQHAYPGSDAVIVIPAKDFDLMLAAIFKARLDQMLGLPAVKA